MSDFEHRNGSFFLFKNDKEGNEARPDYTGEGKDMDGNNIRVSAWLKDGAKGKFMSCRIELKEDKKTYSQTGLSKKSYPEHKKSSEDIPF